MAKVFSILIVLVGLLGGMAAGHVLRPAPETAQSDADDEVTPDLAVLPDTSAGAFEVVRIADQFVVPILRGGTVEAVMVIALSLELGDEAAARLERLEPRLRDRFLQVLFDHANSGGFDGAFTSNTAMSTLRDSLREAAQEVLGPQVSAALITDLFKRDV